MINLKELEKVVTSGKVATVAIMIDGKELVAFSFTLDTIAFKEILEITKVVETINIPDKKVEPAKAVETTSAAQKSFDKKADKALGKTITKKADKPEPEPMDDDVNDYPEGDNEDDSEAPFEDKDDPTNIPTKQGTLETKQMSKPTGNPPPDPVKLEKAKEIIAAGEKKALTREEIMAQIDDGEPEAEEDVKAPEEKAPVKTELFEEEW